MSNAAGCHKPVEYRYALRHHVCASRRVRAIVHFTGVRIAVLTRERFRLVGVGQAQVQPFLRRQRLDGIDELAVGQLIQTQMTVAASGSSAFVQQGQNALVQYITCQSYTHGAAGFGNLAAQGIRLVGIDTAFHELSQLAGDGLGRNQADIEISFQIAIVTGYVHRACQQFDGRVGRQRFHIGPHHRYDLVTVDARAGKYVFPLKRLHRPDVGILFQTRCARHAGFESHKCR